MPLLANFELSAIAIHKDTSYEIRNKDYLFKGDGLKLIFKYSDTSKLKIYYKHENEISKLFDDKLDPQTQYFYPAADKQLLFNKTGEVAFYFEIDGVKTKELIVNYVEQGNMIDVNLDDSNTINQHNNDSFTLQTYGPDLSDINGNQRGALEAKIYKQLLPLTCAVRAGSKLGSGVVVKKGFVLTNYHVISGEKTVQIAFKPKNGSNPEKNSFLTAKISKVSPVKDLALLEVLDEDFKKNSKPISFSKINKAEVGDDIFTIGHPQGELFTFDSGIISQVRNNYSWQTNDFNHRADYIVQTKNSISMGNSGGPIVNDNLELVGITTFSNTKGQNLNFAISVHDITSFINDASDNTPKAYSKTHKIVPNKFNILKTVLAKDKSGNPIKVNQIDTNNNGKVDCTMVDNKLSGRWHRYYFDRNENGIHEEMQIDDNNNGIAEAIYLDTNEDRRWDVIKYDKNEDGIIERTNKY